MARFTIAKRRPSDNGWRDDLVAKAVELDPTLDPLVTSHHEFIDALVEHHLNEIRSIHLTT